MLHFKAISPIDRACTGIEAFSLLIPSGWRFEGGIRWSPDNAIMPASIGFRASGIDITVQVLPGQSFFWTGIPQVRLSHPIGSRYLGATVCPVLKAEDVIKGLMLPALRAIDDYDIVEFPPTAKIDGELGYGATFKEHGSASSEGARLRVEYRQDGRTYEEELFCTVTAIRFAVGSELDYIFWMADNMVSFRAEKGKLDENAGILQAMMHSFRLSPAWFEKYNRIVLFLKDRQMSRPYSLRQLSVEVDREGRPLEQEMRFYAMRGSAYRWIAANIGRRSSTEEYYDPVQQICVRLPAGYGEARASGRGEYILLDAGDVLQDGRWEPMEPIGLPGAEGASTAAAGII